MKELPEKMSDLLELAVKDVLEVEKDPRYMLRMSYWHVPNGVCEVCMAGAVMVRELGVNTDDTVFATDEFGEVIGDRLSAVNFMREGDLESAYACVIYDEPEPTEDLIHKLKVLGERIRSEMAIDWWRAGHHFPKFALEELARWDSDNDCNDPVMWQLNPDYEADKYILMSEGHAPWQTYLDVAKELREMGL